MKLSSASVVLIKTLQVLAANQRNSEELATARQQIHQLEESLKISELESDRKSEVSWMLRLFLPVANIISTLSAVCNFSGFEIYDLSQVIELLKEEALSLKMVQEDRMNHNTISVLTDDISSPTEDCFTGRNAGM